MNERRIELAMGRWRGCRGPLGLVLLALSWGCGSSSGGGGGGDTGDVAHFDIGGDGASDTSADAGQDATADGADGTADTPADGVADTSADGVSEDTGTDGIAEDTAADSADGGTDTAEEVIEEPVPFNFTLEVTGTGNGRIVETALGIDCTAGGGTCTASDVPGGQTVHLVASADPAYGPVTWSNTSCSETWVCDVDPSADLTVSVTFGRTANLVFVTSTGTTGATLGSAAAADAICEDHAPAGYEGTYVAFLSDGDSNAIDRLRAAHDPDPKGWVRVDGLPVADSLDDLLAGTIFYPPDLDESGTPLAGENEERVFTGSTYDGVATSSTCGTWSTGGQGTDGFPDGTTNLWVNFGSQSCDSDMRVYCFGADVVGWAAPAPVDGLLAWVSSTPFSPGGGPEAADAICQGEADTRPGTYRALLGTQALSALERFFGVGRGDALPWPDSVWVRPDGVAIVAQSSDLGAAADDLMLLAPISVDLSGAYVGNTGVWTGSPDGLAAPAGEDACGEWASGLGTNNGRQGRAASAGRTALRGDESPEDCTSHAQLYCLQVPE